MNLNRPEVLRLLRVADFTTLFTQELGWDRYSRDERIAAHGDTYELRAVAEKRGVQVFVCLPGPAGRIPNADVRAVIERKLTSMAHEHLLIFMDAAREEQLWIYPRRDPGKPARLIPYRFDASSANEMLIQKLAAISFTLNEEEELTLLGVTLRLRERLDRDKLTKAFYKRFAKERSAFHSFLKGIPDSEVQRWYVAVLLNRLMFIYFLQEKGFLGGGEQRYLQKKLSQCSGNYYREFLCPLFFQGFALRESERPSEIRALLGRVPYLNGGIFLKHQIEEWHGETIQIANQAFEGLFAFFDQYRWHLDERPLRDQNEINPDVLGYIFEKYINQKQMGAYYTKEDITEYISKNTVIPYLFDAARPRCRVAFENPGGPTVWGLLPMDPDRYIYAAVKHGVIREDGMILPEGELPDFVRTGMHDPKARMFDQRYNLQQAPAQDPIRLVTETWREYVCRRNRCLDIRQKLQKGEVRDINDLITLNLDIRQFAQDVIEDSEGPEVLRAFWQAMNGHVPDKSHEKYQNGITILDPTCGSGAFLFAALNILEPLYEACLERMAAFVDDLDRSPEKHRPEKLSDFRRILKQVADHPNRRYFIFKTIILNNLFGVDIMEEAVEICKLRLFLKLAAQVEPDPAKENFGIEPLPDIDFNIQSGNTLVGYATAEEVRKVFTEDSRGQTKLQFGEVLTAFERFEEEVEKADRQFKLFRKMQTAPGLDVKAFAGTKEALRERLKRLGEELNRHLAKEYGINVDKKKEYEKWLKSHQPFHWFVEFYGIMQEGGFDVIIGNPPWIEYSKVKEYYLVRNYKTEACGNLHGICTERALCLRSAIGNVSFIVQLPLMNSSRMSYVRQELRDNSKYLALMSFDDRPGKLFDGLEHCRAVIWLSRKKMGRDKLNSSIFTSRYHRWPTDFRPFLFDLILTIPIKTTPLFPDIFPKYSDKNQETIFEKTKNSSTRLLRTHESSSRSDDFIFYQEATGYWIKATVGLPYYEKDGLVGAPAHGRYLYLQDSETAQWICAILNSSLFYIYFITYSDCFHLSNIVLKNFHVPFQVSQDSQMMKLSKALLVDLKANATKININTKAGNNISYDEYFGWKSKVIIDKIDLIISKYLNLSGSEVDFIVNYDIKYRMRELANSKQ